ncbi:C-type lectin domain family 2 member B-like [Alligator mississippiensis]|uniref:C-type lectin domain family 2 member B-like n=1 Tax=Alligator mississippiensis TaxID=8496 RepID=A0A151NGG3_ALLMI|nr:C-type lectin domain family 2 member B-like [Alligator mississippiensis]
MTAGGATGRGRADPRKAQPRDPSQESLREEGTPDEEPEEAPDADPGSGGRERLDGPGREGRLEEFYLRLPPDFLLDQRPSDTRILLFQRAPHKLGIYCKPLPRYFSHQRTEIKDEPSSKMHFLRIDCKLILPCSMGKSSLEAIDAQDFQAHAENSTAFSDKCDLFNPYFLHYCCWLVEDEIERYIKNQKVQSYLTDDLQYKEVKKTSPEEVDVKRDQKKGKAGTQTVYMFRRCTVSIFIILTLIIIFALAAALGVKKDKLPSTSHQVTYLLVPAASCPDGWIGYRRKCYYFSEDEGNWTLSQSICSSYNSSLTVINSQEDMNFVMRYKGTLDHWIGLSRKPGQPWKWTDGTDFNNWFEVKGNSLCAYLNEFAVSSSGCYTERNWICSRPDEYTQRQQKDSEVMVT